jgi:hypothetical protein
VIATIRRTRRLQDTLLTAVHRACDGDQLDIAARLLRLAEEVVAEEPDLRRRRQDRSALIAAHERLWHLRHGDPDQGVRSADAFETNPRDAPRDAGQDAGFATAGAAA